MVKNPCSGCGCLLEGGLCPERTHCEEYDLYIAVLNEMNHLTKEDLIIELKKRDGVEEIDVEEDRKWYLTIIDDIGFGCEAGKGYGQARILVVRQND